MPSKRLAKAGVTKEKFDSCVAKVGTGGGKNPYAICNASFNKSKGFKSKKK
jgi:hypothetical protein